MEGLQIYMRERAVKLSRGHDLAKAFNYILKRWGSFTLFHCGWARVSVQQRRRTRIKRHRAWAKILALLRI